MLYNSKKWDGVSILEKSKKPFYKKWWFITLAVFFVLSAIGAAFDNGESGIAEEETQTVSKPVTKEEKKEKMKEVKTPDVIATEFIKKEFGTNKDEKKRAVISTTFENGIVEGVALQETYWSPKTAKQSFITNSVKFMEKMKSLKEVTQATLVIQTPLTDQYGNVKNGEVMRVTMNRETLDKINFENFDAENLSSVADNYYEHQALSAE